MFLYLIALYRTCYLYGTTKQQQFLGKGCLTRIGVRYNGKRTATANFFLVFHLEVQNCEN